jgi:putative ABC transport system permease protein
MDYRALASAFDMEGGFNDVAIKLLAGASSAEVIAELDRVMAPYGGLGAIPRALQFSHWTLDSELSQLQNFGLLVPLLFLGVAAFILNVALTRQLTLQRPQIASLKALGYTNAELAWHYLKWALLIAAFGAVLGTGAGAWLGRYMIQLYNRYFRFPLLDYRLSLAVTASAMLGSLGAAALGALSSVRRAVNIPPAEAMRPESPARYRVGVFEWGPLGRRLHCTSRMILRNIQRQPFRALASVSGIALAAGILVVGFFFIDAMDVLKELQFSYAQRQDATLSFVEPVSARAWYELRSLPGVQYVEPLRSVPARLRSGHRARNLAILGLPAVPTLNRIVDRTGRVVTPPPSGLLLSKTLADVLRIKPGESVQLEILEGTRPVHDVMVMGLVDDILGLSVYMEQSILHRLMREGESLSGAYLQIDDAELPRLYRRLRATPALAGISLTRDALHSFERTMAENMGVMTMLNVIFAGIIAFGVVYNAARVSLSERSHELASLRVLGFTRAEISLILLGELAILTLVALPLGVGLGFLMAKGILAAVESEVYRFPFVITWQNAARSALAVAAAAAFSGLVVRRRLDRLDLIAVLKVRE